MTFLKSSALGVFIWMLAADAQAVTLDVCPLGCTYSTIQSAVDAAAPGDVIDIAAGTYAGDVDISTADLTIQGAGAGSTIVEGLGFAAFIFRDTASPALLSDVTLSSPVGVSCLYNYGAALTVRDSDVIAFIDSTDFLDNSADGQGLANYDGIGGAIYSAGELNLTNSVLDGNYADESGGGVAVLGDQGARIANCVFTDNFTTFVFAPPPDYTGGGLFVESGGTVTVTGSTFEGNLARTGGAIGSYNLLTGGAITIRTSSLLSNTALFGGGVYAFGGDPVVIRRSTISGNGATALGGGGGVSAGLSVTIDIRSSTISGNTSEAGGGGVFDEGGTVIIRNTILTGNTAMVAGAGGSTDDCDGSLDSDDFNLVGTDGGCVMTAQANDLVGTDPAPIDAVLLALADNGGPTQTMLPDTASPALDSGGQCSLRDQRGLLRPADGGTGVIQCDRGATEVNGACTGPGTATVLAPTGGSVVDAGRPLLTWAPAKDALTYDIRLFIQNSLFSRTLIAATNGRTAMNWSPAVTLASNTNYSWRVIAHSHCGLETTGLLTFFSTL